MSFFPWILVWVSLPLSGSVLLFFSHLDKENSKKVAFWCIGWFFAFSCYLIFYRSLSEEYYPFLDLYLKLDPEILWAGLGVVLIITMCIVKEGEISLGLGLAALMLLCLVVHQWMWFWIVVECLFVLTLACFGLFARNHKIIGHGFFVHLVFSFLMAIFVYHYYADLGTFQNASWLTSHSLMYLGGAFLCYTPLWPFFEVWGVFFSKSKLLGKMVLGIFFWLLFFCALGEQKVPQGLYYGVLGLSLIGVMVTYRKKSKPNRCLVQFILLTGPLYFSIFLHHSFESLILVMINTGLIVLMYSVRADPTRAPSFLFPIDLIWAMVQPFFFLWESMDFLDYGMVMGAMIWLSVRFYTILAQKNAGWTYDPWSIGLISWNVCFPLVYDLIS